MHDDGSGAVNVQVASWLLRPAGSGMDEYGRYAPDLDLTDSVRPGDGETDAQDLRPTG